MSADEPLRIAIVVPRYEPLTGGIETHVKEIARYAVSAGHEVDVLTQREDADSPDLEVIDGVRVRRLRLVVRSTHYAVSPGIWRFLVRNKSNYDVFHAHNYHALPSLAAAGAGVDPLVLTPHYHGTSATRFRRMLHKVYRHAGDRMFRRANAIICVSKREASLLEKDFPGLSGRIEVIHNGVDLEAIQSAEAFDQRGHVILSAGRLEDYKQVDRVILAMEHLPPDFSLVVVGGGPMQASLERLRDERELGARVTIRGRVEDDEIRQWFRTCAVYVTMSQIEAMPITPLEVLASGAKVVASDIDAHREIAEIGGGGVSLVPAGISPPTLAAAIQSAVASGPTSASIAGWDEVGERTLEVYERVLGK